MLLMVMTGALAVAGLVGAVIVKFGGKRRNDQEDDYEEIQGDRRPVWGLERTERARPLPLPASAAHRPNIGMPRELRAADDPDDKITEMLARLAKSAQS
ncbi:hypothetical protein [Bradyrhizobium canariense]|nr:hypothetical protein [Bradyrhizobium canariense]